MHINELVKRAHENAVNKGFWDDYKSLEQIFTADDTCNACKYGLDNFNTVGDEETAEENRCYLEHDDCRMAKFAKNIFISNTLMLCVSELGEAVEGLRKGDDDNFAEELADVVIRIGDLCGGLNIDLQAAIEKKMARNESRERLHGKEF